MVEGLGSIVMRTGLGSWGSLLLRQDSWRADLIEVFDFEGFENLNPDRFFQVVGDGARRGHSFKLFKKRVVWMWGSSSSIISSSSLCF